MELTDRQQTIVRCAVREQIRNLIVQAKDSKWAGAKRLRAELEQVLVLFLTGDIHVQIPGEHSFAFEEIDEAEAAFERQQLASAADRQVL